MSQVFTYNVATLILLIESKPCLWDKIRDYVFKERVKAPFQISYSQHWMYTVLSFAFFVFSPKIQEYNQVALPVSMHKLLSCAAFSTKLATGSGNAGTCEKLHDRSRNRIRHKPVCVQAALGSALSRKLGGGKTVQHISDKTNIYCPCHKWNEDSSVIQFVSYSLYSLSYPGFSTVTENG
jgi:hypothetical protein